MLNIKNLCSQIGSAAAALAEQHQQAAADAAAAQRQALLQQRAAAPSPQFYTKRVADPGMIPTLVAAGVEFGAVKVLLLSLFWLQPLC